MIKVFNSDYEFLSLLDVVSDCHTYEFLETGTKCLAFQAPINDDNLDNLIEENYVETVDYNYVIKEVNYDDNGYISVYCIPNYEDISASLFQIFDLYQLSMEDGYKYCVSNSDWTVEYNSLSKTSITYQTKNVSGVDMIRTIAQDYGQEVWFDTKNKILKVYDEGGMGNQIGSYYSNELRIRSLKKEGSSYDYATVLYPIGKDGLTIKDINGGKTYLTNYSYTKKYIEKIWEDDSFEYAEDLKKAAEDYLEELANPVRSYQLSLSTIGDCNIGDTVFIVDKIKKIKQKQRVVEIIRYPFEPENSSIVISNVRSSFTESNRKELLTFKKDIAYIKEQIKNL